MDDQLMNGMDEPNSPSEYQLDIKKIGERVPTAGLIAPCISPGTPNVSEREHASTSPEKILKTTADEHAKMKRDSHCFRCHKKGGEPLCKTCQRVYHRFCAKTCEPCGEPKSNNIPRDRMSKLIETIVVKLKETDNEKVYHYPVDLTEYPDYLHVVVRPIDLGVMHQKAIDGAYESFEQFLTDVTQLHHNSVVYNTTAAWVTNLSAKLMRRANTQFRELKKCPTCFLRRAKNDPEWFLKTCSDPHLILWAKVRSYPFWPAKFFGYSNGLVEVLFFGDHSKANVKVKDCFLYGEGLFEMVPSNAKAGYDRLSRVAMKELSEHLNRVKARWGDVRLATTRVPFDPDELSTQKRHMFSNLTNRVSLKRSRSEESESNERSPTKKPNIVPCSVRLERCSTKFLREWPTDRHQSVECRIEDDASFSSHLPDSPASPYISKVQSLHESDVTQSRSPRIREELRQSPRHSTSSNNAVSSTSDATATSFEFDADHFVCCQTVFQMADIVVRLCMQTDCKETQFQPDRRDASSQMDQNQVPCEQGKIAVRKDLMENRNSTSGLSTVLPPGRTNMESFEVTNMSEQIVKAVNNTMSREELIHKIFDITENMAIQYKRDVESAKAHLVSSHAKEIAALEVERCALVHKLRKAEAIARYPPHLMHHSDEDTGNPVGMMTSAPTAIPSQPRPKKCNRCPLPSNFACCPVGVYCSNICQSEDWIRHSKKCHKCKEVQTNVETVPFSGNSLGQARNKRTLKLRKHTGGGSGALSSHSLQGNANLLSLPSTSSSVYPLNFQLDSHPSRTVRCAASDKGSQLTMAARKMMPPNLSDMDSLTHGVQKRHWKRPGADGGS